MVRWFTAITVALATYTAAASVAAMLGGFGAGWMWGLWLVLAGVAGWTLRGSRFLAAIDGDAAAAAGDGLAPTPSPEDRRGRADRWLGWGSVAFIAATLVWPVVLWPMTGLADEIAFDVEGYHVGRAIDLAQSGSAWSTEAMWWQYPWGSEALMAGWIKLMTRTGVTGSLNGLGVVHAPMVLWFVMGLVVLLRRAGVSAGWSWFWAACFVSWWMPGQALRQVGKNDTLLHASALACAAVTPWSGRLRMGGERGGRDAWAAWVLFSLAGLVGLATKPNIAFALTPCGVAWLVAGARTPGVRGRQWAWASAVGVGCIAAGLLWLPRNLALMGEPFNADVMDLSGWSIWAQRGNEGLWVWRERTAEGLGSAGVAAAAAGVLVARGRWGWAAWVVMGWVGYLLTPASAWWLRYGSTEVYMPRYLTATLAATAVAAAVALQGVRGVRVDAGWRRVRYGVAGLVLVSLAADARQGVRFDETRWAWRGLRLDYMASHEDYGPTALALIDDFDGAAVYIHDSFRFYAAGTRLQNRPVDSVEEADVVVLMDGMIHQMGGRPDPPDFFLDWPAWGDTWRRYDDPSAAVGSVWVRRVGR